MADETLVGLVGSLFQAKNLAYPNGGGIRKNGVGTRMQILCRPYAVLVLGDTDQPLGLHSAMAIARSAGTGPAILAGFTRRWLGLRLLWLLRLRIFARFDLSHRRQVEG